MIPVADLDSVLAEWLPPLSLIVIAIAYATRMIHLGDQGRPVPRWRQGFFLAALIVLAVAYTSPIDRLSDELLTFHMVQHLLIMDIAALFFVLGLTGPLMQPLLALRGFRWVRHLANPSSRCRSGRRCSTSGTSRRSTRWRRSTATSSTRGQHSASSSPGSPSGCR